MFGEIRILQIWSISFLLFSNTLCSQVDHQKNSNAKGEFQIGPNYGVFHDNNSRSLIGLEFQALCKIRITNWLYFGTGIDYSLNKSFKEFDYSSQFSSIKNGKYSIQSLSLPLAIHFSLDKKHSLELFLGGIIDNNIVGRVKGERTFYQINEGWVTENVDEKLNLLFFNFGPRIGLSYYFFNHENLSMFSSLSGTYRFLSVVEGQSPITNSNVKITLGVEIKSKND